MPNHPLVSVIVPSYNRGYIILRAINSILEQTYDNIEIIIVDDGSTDDTLNILSGYNFGHRLYKIISNKNNHGVSYSRNVGLLNSSGKYISFLDSDDEWVEKNKILEQALFLEREKDYGFVSTGWILQTENTKEKKIYFSNHRAFQDALFERCLAQSSTWFFRKNLIPSLGLFWSLKCEDYEYLMRIGLVTKCFCLPTFSTVYNSSASGDYRNNRWRSVFTNLLIFSKYFLYYPYFCRGLWRRFIRGISKQT